MSLQKYVKVFFIFFFTTQACHPQTTIPNFLEDLEAFLIEKGEKYTAKQFKNENNEYPITNETFDGAATYYALEDAISFFIVATPASLTEMAATFVKNNSKIIATTTLFITPLLAVGLGAYEFNSSLNATIEEAFRKFD